MTRRRSGRNDAAGSDILAPHEPAEDPGHRCRHRRRRPVRERGAGACGRRPGLPHGAQRRGEVHPPLDSRRPPRAGRRVPRAGAGTRGRPCPPGASRLPRRPCPGHRGRGISRRGHGRGLGPRLAGRTRPGASRRRSRNHVRVAVGRTEATRHAGPGHGRGAGPPAPRRADEPPRHPGHRMARARDRGLSGRARVHDPRPDLPAPDGEPHRRDRSRPGDVVAGRLRQLPAPRDERWAAEAL